MREPCKDCVTLDLCAAVRFECGHVDTERVTIRKRTSDEMITELQMLVHVLTARVEALEKHHHTITVSASGYTQIITTSGIGYVPDKGA